MEQKIYSWPYANEVGQQETITSDVLVLGGGLSGCFAAIAAARRGLSVVLVEKGAVEKSGSAGTGFDHWESACTNPCSGVTPEEIAWAYVREQDYYSNGIAHYIECREGYDRLLDMESFGGKVRDTEGKFAGAEFRDDETKLMFAYDYKNKFTLRVWGSTFKPALYKELKRLGVKVMNYTEATALLVGRKEPGGKASGEEGVAETKDRSGCCKETGDAGCGKNGEESRDAGCGKKGEKTGDAKCGKNGEESGDAGCGKKGEESREAGCGNNGKESGDARCGNNGKETGTAKSGDFSAGLRGAGAMGMNVHTGKFYVFRAKSTILAMSRPARVWLFDADTTGLCEFRPMQSIGSGHAMGWRAGIEFTMMEKSVRAEFSAAGRSFPPYGAGNNHNTWYAATMVDARGVEIPYVDRDGRELKTVSERYYPARGQKFFLKGGVIDNPKYEYRGPETLDFGELMKRGYQLPFYADLSRMPDAERRVIWGMMVGEEAKTKIPIYRNYTERGFDPQKHMLQSYGTGWQSANFLEQERQFFGAPGGVMHDWDLKTNIDGIYAAGDQLYASDCAGFACATGYYAGRKASDYAKKTDLAKVLAADVETEKKRLYAPLYTQGEDTFGWKELNMAISKAMQNYCGGTKCEALLKEGLDLLKSFEAEIVPRLHASNPHELMRTHEVLDILTVAELVLDACLARKSSSAPLFFNRSDYPELDPPESRHHIVIRQENGRSVTREAALDFFGDLRTEYEKRNQDYFRTEPHWDAEAGKNVPPKRRRDAEAGKNVPPKRRRDAEAGKNKPTGTRDSEAGKNVLSAGTWIAGEDFSAGGKESQEISRKAKAAGDTGKELFFAACENPEKQPEIPAVEFQVSPVPCSTNPLKYDQSLCIGCGRCASVCQCDVLFPSPEKGKHPVVMYPGECYYCGACVMVCPRPGALRLSHPLMNRAKFIPVKKERQQEENKK